MTTRIDVAAAVIRDSSGRLLLAQRPEGKHLAGLWEFPGGKCEPDEAPEQALARELHEELGIDVDSSTALLSLTHHYPEKSVRLLIRLVEAWHGEPHGREGQPLDWFELAQARELPMPAADRPILQALSLDPRCVSISANTDRDRVRADWQEALDAGFRFLCLDADGHSSTELEAIAAECGLRATERNARWLLRGTPEQALSLGADGVQLSSKALRALSARPLPHDALVLADCDTLSDLERAGEMDLDLVCVAMEQGSRFTEYVAESPLPVIARDASDPKDLDCARESGAFGIGLHRRDELKT
ncbi:MAG: Nudix family hydrolase [Pseudomonadota bacterium]